jgi:hypothetical protein
MYSFPNSRAKFYPIAKLLREPVIKCRLREKPFATRKVVPVCIRHCEEGEA